MSDSARSADGQPSSRPRLLVLTPDFPPSRGGIQLLVHRLVTGMSGFETRVVALDSEHAREFDATSPLRVRRVPAYRRLGASRNLPLNAVGLLEAISFRPELTLSAHIVTSPAAAVVRRALGAQTVQYFYAKEIADKPRLAAFAARQADAVISISAYTTSLLVAAGVRTSSLHVIPPGVDLPADASPKPAARPTILTIARLA
ncbi:MAG TPA: glycosyltransferase, partial [Solirubrobacteraceae bacterium]|nr:glycosyltransferase [Solirubrobacteraceae bacterium]